MTTPIDFLNRAEELAPLPSGPNMLPADWSKHYAAQAMAAHAGFRVAERSDPGPALGYLITLGMAALAAAVALEAPASEVPRLLWELTPEAGALNGEYIDFLADLLERHGINPADLYPWYDARDFTSPARYPQAEAAR